jgi:hypothetical protein
MVVLSYADDGPNHPPVYYPWSLGLWGWQKSLGLTVTTLPNEIVEEEINRSPAMQLSGHSMCPRMWRSLLQAGTTYGPGTTRMEHVDLVGK